MEGKTFFNQLHSPFFVLPGAGTACYTVCAVQCRVESRLHTCHFQCNCWGPSSRKSHPPGACTAIWFWLTIMWRSSGDCKAERECRVTQTTLVKMPVLVEGRVITTGDRLHASAAASCLPFFLHLVGVVNSPCVHVSAHACD